MELDAVRNVAERLNKRRSRANENIDAVAKSLRRHQTEVYPLFRDRVDLWNGATRRKWSIRCSKSYRWLDGQQNSLKPNTLLNWIFQPLFDQEEPNYQEVIALKISNTTNIKPGYTVRDEVTDKIKIARLKFTRIPDIIDIATDYLGFNVVKDLTNYTNSKLSRSITEFINNHNNVFPTNKFLTVPGRRITNDLVMNVKYYPGRDDNRAYCMDLNGLRALCGAMLHRLFLPKRMSVRHRLYMSSLVPAKGKDVLDMNLPNRTDDCVSLLLILDISNFTGSAANAWLMLHIMALELDNNENLVKEPNLFSVGEEHITASWKNIISLYLYLTVGYPCMPAGSDSFHFLPGGFLGVNANITVALMFYSVILTDLSRNRPGYVKYFKAQAGGDDAAFLLQVKRTDVWQVKSWIHGKLTRYVGHVKEISECIIEDQATGILPGMLFCKKRIAKVINRGSISIISEEAIPLTELLTDPDPPKNPQMLQEAWFVYDRELLYYSNRNPGTERITNALRALFLDRFPTVTPTRRHKTLMPFDEEIISLDFFKVTPAALSASNKVSLRMVHDRVYYTDPSQRITYLLGQGVLLMVDVLLDGLKSSIVCTESESRRIQRRYNRSEQETVVVSRARELIALLK